MGTKSISEVDVLNHAEAADDGSSVEGDVLVEDELLVEEVSIDGMCGVY